MSTSNDASRLPAFYERQVWAWLLLALSLGTCLMLGSLRHSVRVQSGDEPTFIAMTESLVRDGDLLFRTEDRQRLQKVPESAARSVILERTPRGIAYSKPIVYSVMTAPWVAVFGTDGMLVANAVFLGVALFLAWTWLRRRSSTTRSAWALCTWVGASVVPAYVAWQMSDALQVALVLGGAVLAMWPTDQRRPRHGMALLGGAALGLLVAMRYPNALLVLGVVGVLLVSRRPKRALLVAVTALVVLGATALMTRQLTGAADPYTAERTTVGARSGLEGSGSESTMVERQFRRAPATHHLEFGERFEPVASAYSSLYFWIGRHTGVLIYFPAILGLLWVGLRRPDRAGAVLMLAAGLLALFYLLWTPRNYFGGGTFLGNRYILTAYPLLLLALPRLPRPRVWLVAWLVAILAAGSAVRSELMPQVEPGDSQGHTYAGLFRVLPYESTAHVVGTGTRDRYWAGDFVRFVDPYAKPRRLDFEISSRTPSAGLEIATATGSDHIYLLVTSESQEAELEVGDWKKTRSTHLGPRAGGIKQLVDVPLSAAWRVHRFWWKTETGAFYHVRLTRWKVEDLGSAPVTLRVRYLGGGRLLHVFSGQTVRAPEIPKEVVAGTQLRLRLQVRNTSGDIWRHDGVAPVRLGYRIEALDEPVRMATTGRAPLPWDVRVGVTVPVDLTLHWPNRPGRYRLVIDGVVEDVAWFADHSGQPLFAEDIQVSAAPSRPGD